MRNLEEYVKVLNATQNSTKVVLLGKFAAGNTRQPQDYLQISSGTAIGFTSLLVDRDEISNAEDGFVSLNRRLRSIRAQSSGAIMICH